jgi:transcriptional regulator with XRE-family HTH domain
VLCFILCYSGNFGYNHFLISDKTISAWETGERDINFANAKLICELFDIPNSYFVFNENFENIPSKHKPLIQEYIKTTEF